jgi:serine/threonine protein kinase
MISKSGIVKVADFGLARETDSSVTQTGIALGTPHYMSPEQVRGEHSVDIRSDIYSLGASLYHMVTGSPPFVGTSAAVVITKHLSEEVPHPKEKNPKLSDGLCQVILRMMEKDQTDRYQSAQELLRDMEILSSGVNMPRQAAVPVGAALAAPGLQCSQGTGSSSVAAALRTRRRTSQNLPAATTGARLARAGTASSAFRSRRQVIASRSVMDNYIKPIFIGIAASLFCILTALGIYFTFRPSAPRPQPPGEKVEVANPGEATAQSNARPLPPKRTPGS